MHIQTRCYYLCMKYIMVVSVLVTLIAAGLFVFVYKEKSNSAGIVTSTLIDAVSLEHPKSLLVLEPPGSGNSRELVKEMLNNYDWRLTQLFYSGRGIDEVIQEVQEYGLGETLFDTINQDSNRVVVLAEQTGNSGVRLLLISQNDILIDNERSDITLTFEIKCLKDKSSIDISGYKYSFLTCDEADAAVQQMASSIRIFDKLALQEHIQNQVDDTRRRTEELDQQVQKAYEQYKNNQ